MTSLETIERWARLGKAKEMTDFLLGLSAAERDGLKDGVRKLVRKAQRDETFYAQAETEDAQRSKGFGREKASQAARLAALATLGISDLKKIRWSDSGEAEFWGYSHWEPWRLQKLRILEALKPAWLQEFAELLLNQSLDIWFFVRALIRKGLCQSLKSPQYTFGMALEMRHRRSTWYINDEIFKRQLTIEQFFKNDLNSIEAALLEDEDLLKDDVWSLFDYEGDSRASLASLEAAAKPEDSWRETLVKLSHDARLPRERLINRCLDAIARDYKSYYAAWFLGVLKALKLTTEEVAANQERFLHLLGSSNPTTIKLALENLAALQKAKLLDQETFIASVEPAFRMSAKGTVNQALKLLEFSIKANPKLIRRGLEMATTALLNESVEVQAAVMTLLEKHPESRPILSAYRDSIAPSNKARFERICGVSTETPAPHVENAADLHETAEPASVEPIESLDDLLDRASYGLENPEDIMELERVLDGLSRLCPSRRTDMPHYAGALLQKCVRIADPANAETWTQPVEALAHLLRNWILNENQFADGLPDSPSHDSFLVRRIVSLKSHVMAGVGLPLLAAPTNAEGWINPMTLVGRAEVWSNSQFKISDTEVVAALLRIGHEGRDEALNKAQHLPGEIGAAIRYALGEGSTSIGPTPAIWIAAARARHPGKDDLLVEAVHGGFGPDAALVAHYAWEVVPTRFTKFPPFEIVRITRRPSPPRTNMADYFTTLTSDEFNGFSDTFAYFYPHDVIAWKWATLIWPDGSEAFLANGVLMLANYSDTQAKEFYKIVRALFGILHRKHFNPGPMSMLFVAFACVAKSSEIRSLATDGLIHLNKVGKVDANEITHALAKLSSTKSFFYGGRLASVLSEVARLGSPSTRFAASLVDGFLASNPSSESRELTKLLEVFAELSINADYKLSEAANAFLGQIPATPKLTKLMKRMNCK